MPSDSLRIAVEGCGHGTLNAIYSSINKSCQLNGWDGVDLLIIGGDFQAVRNSFDLNCMSVPVKFCEIGDFHEYYSGTRKAPYLTIFVGGNHEASNYLFELYYGGWVAPNIYYLGAANVVRFGPLRIASLSGIWKGYNYNKPHFERLPYGQDDIKSIYHVREYDVRKLLQLRTQVDIGISHDWPRGVEWMGDWKALFLKKDLFEADARAGTLGSLAAKYVMDRLRPPHWFSAHLHCKFPAIVDYTPSTQTNPIHPHHTPINPNQSSGINHNTDEINIELEEAEKPIQQPGPSIMLRNEDEIDIDMEDDTPAQEPRKNPSNSKNQANIVPAAEAEIPTVVSEELRALLPPTFARPAPPIPPATLPHPESISNKTTRFLALDKCLPNRKFLQILEINPISSPAEPQPQPQLQRPYILSYDKEWLAITRVFAPDLTVGSRSAAVPPDKGHAYYRPFVETEERWVKDHVVARGNMRIPENFEVTAPVYDAEVGIDGRAQPREYTNSQTARFCEMLGIGNPFDVSEEERDRRIQNGPPRGDSSRMDGGRGGFRGRGGGRGRGRGRGDRGRGRGRGRDPR
ncbi:hypothetical protein MMC14_005133 [Varicellaria rhodocarpa]|nr:hypothetical protein [Varicellaria rhodocarpa]